MARGAKKEGLGHVGIPVGPHVEEYLVSPTHDADGVQVSSGIGKDGKEYPDPVPMSVPSGYVPPNDLSVMLEQLFRRGRQVLEDAGIETEEEANDFEIEDDPLDPLTEYEKVFMPGPVVVNGSGPVVQAAAEATPKEPPPAAVEPKAAS